MITVQFRSHKRFFVNINWQYMLIFALYLDKVVFLKVQDMLLKSS